LVLCPLFLVFLLDRCGKTDNCSMIETHQSTKHQVLRTGHPTLVEGRKQIGE